MAGSSARRPPRSRTNKNNASTHACRRIVFPWCARGLSGGSVPVDVVFRETLAEPADKSTTLPATDGGCISVRAAGPAQSLAWKLAWLATDWYPQGKDVYDAVS